MAAGVATFLTPLTDTGYLELPAKTANHMFLLCTSHVLCCMSQAHPCLTHLGEHQMQDVVSARRLSGDTHLIGQGAVLACNYIYLGSK